MRIFQKAHKQIFNLVKSGLDSTQCSCATRSWFLPISEDSSWTRLLQHSHITESSNSGLGSCVNSWPPKQISAPSVPSCVCAVNIYAHSLKGVDAQTQLGTDGAEVCYLMQLFVWQPHNLDYHNKYNRKNTKFVYHCNTSSVMVLNVLFMTWKYAKVK